ncbi:hypothetical protein HJFPF1_13515 [Paramyrothecium foliicola]|nr:hypothetical protein HJFPF1_13515 [Paramyrothecium foliicola]
MKASERARLSAIHKSPKPPKMAGLVIDCLAILIYGFIRGATISISLTCTTAVIIAHSIVAMVALCWILGTVIACGVFVLLMLPVTTIIVFSTRSWKMVIHWKKRSIRDPPRLPNESQLNDSLRP